MTLNLIIKMYSFNLNHISKYRTELMGLSAIMIILCHVNVAEVKLHYLIKLIIREGNLGVDIFLFLSGLGLFYSLERFLEKYEFGNIYKWYWKRFTRLLLPYLLIMVPYWIF